MADEITVTSMLGKKSRPIDGTPYLVFTNLQGWTWRVLKTWQNDDAKDFARWFVAASSPHTFGGEDLGDTYVRDVVTYGTLVEVDGREPTVPEMLAIKRLTEKLTAKPDPMAAYGF